MKDRPALFNACPCEYATAPAKNAGNGESMNTNRVQRRLYTPETEDWPGHRCNRGSPAPWPPDPPHVAGSGSPEWSQAGKMAQARAA